MSTLAILTETTYQTAALPEYHVSLLNLAAAVR
jgi:hypothetical protein